MKNNTESIERILMAQLDNHAYSDTDKEFNNKPLIKIRAMVRGQISIQVNANLYVMTDLQLWRDRYRVYLHDNS